MTKRVVSDNEIKIICNKLLADFSEYCKKNNLRFFLGYGTALGAVRHSGFIPWDDDIDVVMPRPDYEKLIETYDNDVEKNVLLCHEKDKSYYYPFAKLCNKKTELVEEHFSNDSNMGVYIDIFPLDGNGSDIEAAKAHMKECIKTQRKLNNAMAKHFFRSKSNIIKEFMRYIRYYFLRLIGSDFFYNKLDKLVKQYEYQNSKFISNNVWCTYSVRELFFKEMFDEDVLITFEKREYPIVKKYDEYLSSIYGNYMEMPPIDERISHHDMIAYYKDDY